MHYVERFIKIKTELPRRHKNRNFENKKEQKHTNVKKTDNKQHEPAQKLRNSKTDPSKCWDQLNCRGEVYSLFSIRDTILIRELIKV